ncbi:uncharacterized protein LOC132637323 [Lycium barbarum]|uniref:uncharacterized protein LOC132637323 n=1 Tax=Lycium barbarum TaxID=112863 RepID=UPI00293E23E3|nr:uncharacterized protein LOC132637323 [Lycium barbarum]
MKREMPVQSIFFSTIKHKRRRVALHIIKNSDGNWIEGNEAIGDATVQYFEGTFTETAQIPDYGVLHHIEKIINEEDNQNLNRFPEEEEIKNAIMDLSPNCAAGPDGFNGFFFQKCWDIIKDELINFVQSFYCGKRLIKYFTHACLIFIPKVDEPASFSQLRPISLTNFSNKIISKIMATRHNVLLPKLVSENQTGFISGRLITENILLTQEIVHDINKGNNSNLVFKLDMEKAYDRVSWLCIIFILRNFGFSEFFIDLVWRLLSDLLNKIHDKNRYIGYSMNAMGPRINHLAYANGVSGQKINKEKIMYLTTSHASIGTHRRIRRMTGFKSGTFPFTYLGCPIYTGRKKISYFTDITSNFFKRIGSWQGNLLSHGGKAVIIQQWRFRTQKSLWADFLRSKYCIRVNFIVRSWSSSQSQSWKELINCRRIFEPYMLWKINFGSSLFWWDNWIGLGPLDLRLEPGPRPGNTLVEEFIFYGNWISSKLENTVRPNLQHTIESIKIADQNSLDSYIWTHNSDVNFTCSSAREITRQRKNKNDSYSNLWHKGMPFKVAFLNWRILKRKLPFDDILPKFSQQVVSRCNCCN